MSRVETPTAAPLLTGNLLALGSMLAWAMAFPAVEVLLPHMAPLPMAALRMAVAAAAMLPVWIALEGWGALRGSRWALGLAIGAVGNGIAAWALVVAQDLAEPVTVAIVTATMPVVGIALEVLLDGRRLTPWLVGGLVLSLVGGVLAYASGLGPAGFGLGAIAAFVSVLAFAGASRVTVKALARESALGQTALVLAGAALSLAVAAVGAGFVSGRSGVDWPAMGAAQWAALGVLGLVSLGLSQVMWIGGVQRLGVGIASMHINAAPFYVMVFMLALGGGWSGMQVVGALIVVLGVLVSQRR